MKETCTDCKFGHELPWTTETSAGVNTFCRAKPPEFLPPSSSTLIPVQADGWCGQYAEKVQKRRTTTKSVPAPRSDPNHGSFSEPAVQYETKTIEEPRTYGDFKTMDIW